MSMLTIIGRAVRIDRYAQSSEPSLLSGFFGGWGVASLAPSNTIATGHIAHRAAVNHSGAGPAFKISPLWRGR